MWLVVIMFALQQENRIRMQLNRIPLAMLVVLGLAMAGEARAQYDWDIGGHLGGANYLGEMGGKEKPARISSGT